MTEPETSIVLPRSGVVLTASVTCAAHVRGLFFGNGEHLFLNKPNEERGLPYATARCGRLNETFVTVAEALAWLDARVLELRAALSPPSADAAIELADLLLAHDDKVTADPFAVFDRGAFGDRFAALVAKYRAAKGGGST